MSVVENAASTSGTGLNGMIDWLALHGVRAERRLETGRDNATAVLTEFAISEQADLVVTGGYGHSRLREWLLGGVTRGLLQDSTLNRLISN